MRPTATYRLQFRNGTTFATAQDLVPYWRELGISHLYASPIFTAVSGSTHGYDVADQNQIDPALGGHAGFESLSRALRAADMGIILDIVPNHMAASSENPWWLDVLRWGADSALARHFDIDWNRPLTLPVLGRSFDEAIEAGEVSVVVDRQQGWLAFDYFGNRFPLTPATWDAIQLDSAEEEDIRSLAQLARGATPVDSGALQQALRSLKGTHALERLEALLERLSDDRDLLRTLHQQQPWRLEFWKDASRNLSYRRFFEITGLVGLAVEREEVFDDVHSLALELLRDGLVDGFRIDHIDGMADPGGYLRRLRQKAGSAAYIVVEKILAAGEELPHDWPVSGTTGYEFIDCMVDLLVEPEGMDQLSRHYETDTGSPSTDVLRQQSKRQIVTRNFKGELDQLVRLLASRAGAPTELEICAALVELLIALPVYRTYGATGPLDETDRRTLFAARDRAMKANSLLAASLTFIVDCLAAAGRDGNPTALKVRTRFQQLSGPVMAKGVEDTLFYRDHRFLALNEVGGEPDRDPPSLERFHRQMRVRARASAHALSATATHDTKRGEDARARLYPLSEAPDRWAQGVGRWRERHRDRVAGIQGGAAPEASVEWMLYQALVGVWPDPLPEDLSVLPDLRSRFMDYVEKVLREAKTRTSWVEVDSAYEEAVKAYAVWLLDERNLEFIRDFADTLDRIKQAGWLNSLSQTLVKLTAPGVPDIYQGTEIGDFSLVDPDNRRPVNWQQLQDGLGWQGGSYLEPVFKQFMIRRVLQARRAHPALFGDGDYRALEVRGAAGRHLVAFGRCLDDKAAVVVAPRLTMDLLAESGGIDPSSWDHELSLELPDDGATEWRDIILDRSFSPQSTSLSALLQRCPYLVLMPRR